MKRKYKIEDFTSGKNGTISGYFATFHHDHGDSYGGVFKKGTFTKSIERRKESGHPFPLTLNHNWDNIIGRVIDIGEDEHGAYFTAEFFPTDEAQKIRGIVTSGVLWQFSCEMFVLDYGRIRAEDGTKVDEIREAELLEISIVLFPANSRATITKVNPDGKVKL